MKPTSIIFLILAAILIVAGVVVCLVGNSMTSAKEPLLCDIVDTDKNDITTHQLSEFDLTDIDINIENAEVNIIGQSVQSYIEFKNINKVTYDFVINKHKLGLSSVNPFNVSSMVKFRENEGGFGGLRHYLYLNKYKEKLSQVNIYITPDTQLENIKIHTKDGNITVKNMICDAKYDLSAENGSVIFEKTNTQEPVTVNIKKGDLTFNTSKVTDMNIVIENGNGNLTVDRQYSYRCQCVNGSIHLDGENVGESYDQAYPVMEAVEGVELETPGEISGKITAGDLYIVTAE